jgi:hypothetical protein
MGSHARSLVVLLGRRVVVPTRVVREVRWMSLGRYYTITWEFLACLKAFVL